MPCCEFSKEDLICFPLKPDWQGCESHGQADGKHCKKLQKYAKAGTLKNAVKRTANKF